VVDWVKDDKGETARFDLFVRNRTGLLHSATWRAARK
jgi:hypothetical protein